ncbi:MAG: hypothetical protein HXY34_11220, partial [Candidatus Thorarchaeota archaeon]|nr:hypothetical protein [Candidatus Thorarchaeota archaeon]
LFKWRLNKSRLMGFLTIQHEILSTIVTEYTDRPGTELVYSTCSLLPHEGESQIDSLLKESNIELLDPAVGGQHGYPGFLCSERVRRLFPHIHGTSGFFIARFRIR